MKRLLSLLLCISLLVSVNVGTISVSASTEDVTMIEKTNVIVDTTSGTITTAYSGSLSTQVSPKVNDVKQQGVMFSRTRQDNPRVWWNEIKVDNTTFSDATIEFDFHTKVSFMQVQCKWTINNSGSLVAQSIPDNSKVRFSGGCAGNTQGLAALLEGMNADEAIKRLSGIRCGFKRTSCPDQMACAIKEAMK